MSLSLRGLARVVAILIMVAGGTGTSPGQTGLPRAQMPPPGHGAISGVVVDSVTRQPVPEAVVTLSYRSPAVPAQMSRQVTDDRGRFVFLRLGPATGYVVTVEKYGYLSGGYGRNEINEPLRRLSLAEGEWQSDLEIPLFRPAVIAGTVLDEAGEPVVEATVRVLSRFHLAGQERFAEGVATRTNDLGEYRFAELAPGDYIIAVPSVMWTVPAGTSALERSGLTEESVASARAAGRDLDIRNEPAVTVTPGHHLLLGDFPIPPLSADGRPQVYAPTYYPTARSPQDGRIVTVAAGQQRSGIDITLQPAPSSTIHGRVVGAPGDLENLVLRLLPSDAEWLGLGGESATALVAGDGAFTFVGVPAGAYTIFATGAIAAYQSSADALYAMPAPPGARLGSSSMMAVSGSPGTSLATRGSADARSFGIARVQTTGEPLTGVTVNLQRGVSVIGHVVIDDASAADSPLLVSVSAEPANADPSLGRPWTFVQRDDPARAFTIEGLMPGEYVLRARGGSLRVKSITFSGRDITDVPIDASTGRDLTGVVVTLTGDSARLTGTVTSSGGREPSPASVICFPVERERWTRYGYRPDRIRSVEVSSGGDYSIGSLPAGEYYVIAVPSALGNAWVDPEFLERAEPLAVRTSVDWGGVAMHQLTVQSGLEAGRGFSRVDPPVEAGASAPADGEAIIESGPFAGSEDPAFTDARGWSLPGGGPGFRPGGRQAVVGGAIEGMVVSAGESPAPIRRAIVMATGAGIEANLATITGDDGRFVLRNVPAGRVTLTARRPGFVTTEHGAMGPGRPGTPVAVEAGRTVSGLRIVLAPGAVITGVVRDPVGRPAAGASVTAVRAAHSSSVSRFSDDGHRATTDDRGVYRIFGLPPGDYVIAMTAYRSVRETVRIPVARIDAVLRELEARRSGRAVTPVAPVALPAQVYAPIFHPGTPLAADASRIDLEAGETQDNVDFTIDLVAAARVSGVVTSADGASVTSTRLSLMPSGPPLPVFNFSTSADAPDPDGRFVFNGVPPGRYVLLARNTPGRGRGGGDAGLRGAGSSPATAAWALSTVTVRGVDVSDVRLTLRPPITMNGRVTFDDGTLDPPADLTRLRVGLTSPGGGAAAVTLADGTLMSGVAPPSAATVQPDGTFRIGGMLPGVYVPSSSVPGQSGPTGWWLRSAMFGERDLLDLPLELGAEASDVDGVVLKFSDRHSMLSGTLSTSEGQAATDYFVAVLTTDRALWRPAARRVRYVRPASDGAFAFADLPGGDYALAALTNLDPEDLGDPAFLDQVLPAAVPVTIRDGETTTQNLAIR